MDVEQKLCLDQVVLSLLPLAVGGHPDIPTSKLSINLGAPIYFIAEMGKVIAKALCPFQGPEARMRAKRYKSDSLIVHFPCKPSIREPDLVKVPAVEEVLGPSHVAGQPASPGRSLQVPKSYPGIVGPAALVPVSVGSPFSIDWRDDVEGIWPGEVYLVHKALLEVAKFD